MSTDRYTSEFTFARNTVGRGLMDAMSISGYGGSGRSPMFL